MRAYLPTIGPKYLPAQPNTYSSSANAQEAHEAIRPIDITVLPASTAGQMPPDSQTLYDLIHCRALASQSTPAQFEQTIATIVCAGIDLQAKGQTMLFDGFLKFWKYGSSKELLLPKLTVGDVLSPVKVEAIKHTTKPPSRFNTASIVKELEDSGVGRPSTYQTIIDTLVRRGYVTEEGKAFAPTEVGKEVVKVLKEYLPKVVDIQFTAEMEAKLDEIAQGKADWVAVLDLFWKPLADEIANALEKIKEHSVTTDKMCLKCAQPLIKKFNARGSFYVCSDKKCGSFFSIGDNEAPVEKVIEAYTEPCRVCGAQMAKRFVKATGQTFWGCTNYDATGCKTSCSMDGVWRLHTVAKIVKKCDKCKKGNIVIKTSKKGEHFAACDSFPKCKNAMSLKDLGIDKDGNKI
jgi:DNA topoisomerase-1